jgi:transporter family protein
VKTWYLYALLTIVMWGIWGVFSKFASAHSKPRQVLIFQSVGVLAFALVVLAIENFKFEWSVPGFSWSFAAGFFTFIGFLTFFAALEDGKASTVVTLSALYPVVTILLSVIFLREKISLKETVGIGFALVASVLLAG